MFIVQLYRSGYMMAWDWHTPSAALDCSSGTERNGGVR